MKRIVTITLGLLLGLSALAQQRMNGPILVPGDGGAYKPVLLGFPSSTVNGIYSDGVNLILSARGSLLDKNGNPIGGSVINNVTVTNGTVSSSTLTNTTSAGSQLLLRVPWTSGPTGALDMTISGQCV